MTAPLLPPVPSPAPSLRGAGIASVPPLASRPLGRFRRVSGSSLLLIGLLLVVPGALVIWVAGKCLRLWPVIAHVLDGLCRQSAVAGRTSDGLGGRGAYSVKAYQPSDLDMRDEGPQYAEVPWPVNSGRRDDN